MHYTTFLPVAIGLLGQLRTTSAQKTYYVDETCWTRQGWAGALGQTIHNARAVTDRLLGPPDPRFDGFVHHLFKVRRANVTEWQTIAEPFAEIASWVQKGGSVPDLKRSDYRFFCDDDQFALQKHDKLVHKPDGPFRWVKYKGLDSWWWYDYKNYLYTQYEPSCLVKEQKHDFAYFDKHKGSNAYYDDITRNIGHGVYGHGVYGSPDVKLKPRGYKLPHDPHEYIDFQNPDRWVISLCDYMFNPNKEGRELDAYPRFMDQELRNRDWANFSINQFELLLTRYLMYLMVHAASGGKIGEFFVDEQQTGWNEAVKYPAEKALRNVGTYTMLAQISMFMDWGYTVSLMDGTILKGWEA